MQQPNAAEFDTRPGLGTPYLSISYNYQAK